MRSMILLSAVLLLAAPLTGCLGSDEDPGSEAETAAASEIDREDVQAPEGASVEEIDQGYRLLFEDASLPLERDVHIPAGTTMVNVTVDVPGDARASVNVTNTDTGQARCASAQASGFSSSSVRGGVSCAGLTALDEIPSEWTLRVEANASTAKTVEFDLLNVPMDGLAGQLPLEKLSKPVHDLAPRENVTIPSHDGTQLFSTITRPDVDGPVPVILVTHIAGNASAEQNVSALKQPIEPDTFARDMAKRGYAVVQSHVRGTGQSGGCLDVFGPLEQQDQAELISWITEQDWSSEAIGTYGVGYSGSTALEAAITASDQVKATVAFSAVTDAYRDWHFGGVPNGEGKIDPVVGQATGALGYAGAADPTSRLMNSSGSGCSADSFTGSADPRAVYDAFYEARNLTTQANEIQSSVLYGQGLFDRVTKPSMAQDLLGEVQGQSLSMVGPWGHGFPARPDARVMVVAWMDQHLKGEELGLEQLPSSSVTNPSSLAHQPALWPPSPPTPTTLYPDFGSDALKNTSTEGSASVLLTPVDASAKAEQSSNETLIRLETSLDQTVALSGRPQVQLATSLVGLDNAFVSAQLYEKTDEGKELVSFGMANLAHNTGHSEYTPVEPGQLVEMLLPMQPTERVIEANHTLVLEIRSATVSDWSLVQPGKPGQLTLEAGADGTMLSLPTLPMDELSPASTTASLPPTPASDV